jgi:hypothetical protein
MINNQIENQRLDKTIHLELEVKTEPKISSMQEDFLLCEADFVRLKNGKSKASIIAISFFLASIGFGVSFIAKYLASFLDANSFSFETWEWVAPVISSVISLVIYLVCLAIPNDHTKVRKQLKNISKYHQELTILKRVANERHC